MGRGEAHCSTEFITGCELHQRGAFPFDHSIDSADISDVPLCSVTLPGSVLPQRSWMWSQGMRHTETQSGILGRDGQMQSSSIALIYFKSRTGTPNGEG